MKNPFDIRDKVIILTGAGGFLGNGYAKLFAESGAHVCSWDKTEPQVGEMKTAVDITDEAQVEAQVKEVLARFGRIDGLVNNAAMNPAVGSDDAKQQFVPYEQYPIDLFRKEIEVNLTGMMITMKHIAPTMMQQKSGSIVNVASEVSVIAHDHRVYNVEDRYKSPAYTASKTAVLGLTRQWAARLGEFGVRSNAVSLGGVYKEGMPEEFVGRFAATNMLGRMAREGEYGPTMVYLLSDASSFMTGANLIIDGGKSAW